MRALFALLLLTAACHEKPPLPSEQPAALALFTTRVPQGTPQAAAIASLTALDLHCDTTSDALLYCRRCDPVSFMVSQCWLVRTPLTDGKTGPLTVSVEGDGP